MVIYYNVGSTDFTIISLHQISLESQKILWLAFFLAFAVKIPLFPFHIWLPLPLYYTYFATLCGADYLGCDYSLIEGFELQVLSLTALAAVKPHLPSKSEDGTSESQALVVYGTNLGNSIGKRRLTQLVSSMYILHPYQMSVAIGVLMSDGYFYYSGHKKNASFALKQSLAKLEYFFNVFFTFTHYCASGAHLGSSIFLGSRHHYLYFFTRALPCFTELYNLFYPKGIKVIPENIIELLDPIALAHWICGDGEVADAGLRLCTDSYSLPDVVRLINVLIVR
jgi:hypothetical protein